MEGLVASDVELAWAAGLFDGEGTTSVLAAQRDKYKYLRMSVSQKDREVLDKFLAIVKYGKIYKSKTREIHSWDCYRQDQVFLVLNNLWPFLSKKKQEQATKAKEIVEYKRKGAFRPLFYFPILIFSANLVALPFT